jgi:hypothetical protein
MSTAWSGVIGEHMSAGNGEFTGRTTMIGSAIGVTGNGLL